jgi:hypothetical protein
MMAKTKKLRRYLNEMSNPMFHCTLRPLSQESYATLGENPRKDQPG